MRRPSRRISRVLGFTVVPVSLVATGLFVTASSYSVFNATTSNTANNWTAGKITLTDDDANGAMFSVTNIKPGMSGSRCIAVTTSANDLPAKIGLYASGYNQAAYAGGATLSAALAAKINLKVEMAPTGTGAAFTGSSTVNQPGASASSCTLNAPTTIYGATSGTIADFNATRNSYTTATSTAGNVWTTSGGATSEKMVYKFSWNFPDGGRPTGATLDDNQYQGTTTNIDFTWESQTF